MYIKSMGVNFIHSKDFITNRPNGTNEYILLLIRSKAIFKINGETIYANPNSVIVYKKGTPHLFCADNDIYINDWICFDFNDKSEEKIFKETGICFNTVYEVGDTTQLYLLINTIHREYINKSSYVDKITDNYLKILFYKISECINVRTTPYNHYYQKLTDLRNTIYTNPSGRWSIDELAKKLSLSSSYFQYLYKLQFNISPTADIIRSRMEYAKYMLTNTDYTVNKISEELNYGSDIQFIQQFKAVTKTTPLKYRKINTRL